MVVRHSGCNPLIILVLRPALSGDLRLTPPRPMTLAVLLVAAVWVMATAAGGVFDTHNWDWHKHRSILLNLELLPLANVSSRSSRRPCVPQSSSSPHLLRYYLGWYMGPGALLRTYWGRPR